MQIRFRGVRGSVPSPISSEALEDKLVALLNGIQGQEVATPEAARAYLHSHSIFQRGTIGGIHRALKFNTVNSI